MFEPIVLGALFGLLLSWALTVVVGGGRRSDRRFDDHMHAMYGYNLHVRIYPTGHQQLYLDTYTDGIMLPANYRLLQ